MDVPRGIVGNEQPQLWELNEQNKPRYRADRSKFDYAVRFLQERPDWVNENPSEAKKIFSLLERTCHLSTEALAIQRTLIDKFPAFFPTVAVEIGGEEKQIPKERLIEGNVKFQTMFASGFSESRANQIKLNVPDGIDDPEVLHAFLTYVEGGNVEIGENALDLLRLAQENNYPSLAYDCIKVIGENVDFSDRSSFEALMQAASDLQLVDLKWLFIKLASEKSNQNTCQELLTNKEISEDVKKILKYGIDCHHLKYTFGFSDAGKKTVEFVEESEINKAGIEFLKEILEDNLVNDPSLKFTNREDDDLERIAAIIHNPYSLSLTRGDVSVIPSKWLQNLKEVDCVDCPLLKSMIAPQAERASCRQCNSLEEFDAPQAKVLYCGNAPIVSLNALNAKTVLCNNTAIESLHAPKATRVHCNFTPLRSLDAPEVEELDCVGTYLKSLDIPKAKKVNCGRCQFENLFAPEGEVIDFSESEVLISANAPKAVKIVFHHCPAFTTLYAPDAKEIEFSRCPMLTKLTLAEGCKIVGDVPKHCEIIYLKPTTFQKADFQKMIEEGIVKMGDRRQVLMISLSKTIASFFLNPLNRIPFNELIVLAQKFLFEKGISVPENFIDGVADEAIEGLLNGNADLSLVNTLPKVYLEKAFTQMKERLIQTESSEQRAAIARVLLKAQLLEVNKENAQALHDAAVTNLRQLIAPNSTAFASHEQLNDALATAAKLIRIGGPLTADERSELIERLVEEISARRPPIYLRTEADFIQDRNFKAAGQQLWDVLELGNFFVEFDQAQTQTMDLDEDLGGQ